MAASGRDRSSGLQRGATGTIQKLPFCTCAKFIPVVFFSPPILHLRSPLASLLSRDIVPREDEHLVLVIHGETRKLIAVTRGHGSNRAASVSFKLCLQFNDLFVFVVPGERLLHSLSLPVALPLSLPLPNTL